MVMVRKKASKKKPIQPIVAKPVAKPIKLNSIDSDPPGWGWVQRLAWLVRRVHVGPHPSRCLSCGKPDQRPVVAHSDTLQEHLRYLIKRAKNEMKSIESKEGG